MSKTEPSRTPPDNERPVRLRPRAPKGYDEWHTWPAGLRVVLRLLRNTAKSVGTPAARRTTRQWSQRCAVRITYSPDRVRGQWGAHGRYVLRESAAAKDGTPGLGFDAASNEVDAAKLAAEWQAAGDPRMFKLILSPEFGDQVDLPLLTRRLMARMEGDLNRKLEWAAVAHFNTEHPHVHVLLRGLANGAELRLPKEYVKSGLRENAEALCTAQLGYRTELDRADSARREIDQPRFTSLDLPLKRQNTPVNDSPQSEDHFVASISPRDAHLPRRLRVLQSMGLAEPHSAHAWLVRKDFEAVLRAMSLAQDRQRMIARCATLASDPNLPAQFTEVTQIRNLEGRVLGHMLDERSDSVHMLLEGTDRRLHVIPHDASITEARRHGLLRVDQQARLRVRQGVLRIDGGSQRTR